MQILYTIRQSKNVISHCQDAVQFDAVAVGAILSDYQRVRVENVWVRYFYRILPYFFAKVIIYILEIE